MYSAGSSGLLPHLRRFCSFQISMALRVPHWVYHSAHEGGVGVVGAGGPPTLPSKLSSRPFRRADDAEEHVDAAVVGLADDAA